MSIIEIKMEYASGTFNTEDKRDKLICVPKKKYNEVHLCFNASMNITFASIVLHNDTHKAAEEVFESASNLGEEIVSRYNDAPGIKKLLWGAVANVRPKPGCQRIRWGLVTDALGCGSTTAQALCKEHGFDPDEELSTPLDDG